MWSKCISNGRKEEEELPHLEGQRCGEAVRRPGQDPQHGPQGVFDR